MRLKTQALLAMTLLVSFVEGARKDQEYEDRYYEDRSYDDYNNYEEQDYCAQEYEDCCDPCESCCFSGTFFVNASFLYWNARRADLEYVGDYHATITDVDYSVKAVNSESFFFEPNFKWDPGVRASIGFGACDCGPSIFLVGNYFRTKATDCFSLSPSLDEPDLSYGVPLWNPALMGTAVTNSCEEWKLIFGTLDLLFGGRFSPWNCTILMPNMGVRGVWINQNLDVAYGDVVFFTFSDATAPNTNFEACSKFRAVGFKAGIDFQANLFCNFGLVGGFGASLVFGSICLDGFLNGFSPEFGGEGVVLSPVESTEHRKYRRLRANLESELGISYSGCCNGFGYFFAATYMFSLWFDQNDFTNLLFTSNSLNNDITFQNVITPLRPFSNLMLQGVVVTAGVNF